MSASSSFGEHKSTRRETSRRAQSSLYTIWLDPTHNSTYRFRACMGDMDDCWEIFKKFLE